VAGESQFGLLAHLSGSFVATTTGIGAWGDITESAFSTAFSEAAAPESSAGGSRSRIPGDPTPTPTTPTYHLRVEYTTYEFDADDEVEICIVDPVCAVCGGSSGSGDSGASGGTPPPDGPYTGPCTCPPGYSLFLVGLADDGFTPIYRCRNDVIGSIIRPCNEDPANGGGGGGSGGGGAVPSLTVELTTFEVPDTMTAVSVRCIDVTTCEVCA